MTPDLDYDGAAAQLNVSAAWLRKNIRSLPHLKHGRLTRFTPAHIDEIRARNEQRPAEPTAPVDSLRPSTRTRRTA